MENPWKWVFVQLRLNPGLIFLIQSEFLSVKYYHLTHYLEDLFLSPLPYVQNFPAKIIHFPVFPIRANIYKTLCTKAH